MSLVWSYNRTKEDLEICELLAESIINNGIIKRSFINSYIKNRNGKEIKEYSNWSHYKTKKIIHNNIYYDADILRDDYDWICLQVHSSKHQSYYPECVTILKDQEVYANITEENYFLNDETATKEEFELYKELNNIE